MPSAALIQGRQPSSCVGPAPVYALRQSPSAAGSHITTRPAARGVGSPTREAHYINLSNNNELRRRISRRVRDDN